MRRLVIGVSGASGMPLAHALLALLAQMPDLECHCIVSPGALRVLEDEAPHMAGLAGIAGIIWHDAGDIGAPPASGGWWHGGEGQAAMAVVPCSMASLGAIAGGAGRNLLHRAAAVALKERQPLVLVTRESPLSAIDLENMLRAQRAGAVIMPFSPGFYLAPASLEELLDHFCGRICDQLGLRHQMKRWPCAGKERQ